MDPIRQYYQLTKPGIVYGNLLTAAAGYLLGSQLHVDLRVLTGLLAGTWLVIASACVFNNYLDRGIDRKMKRTRKRALAAGEIGVWQALLYASILGILGIAILILDTNGLTLAVGLIGFIDYVLLYGWSKRHSIHGTLVGSISGSAPIVAGYTAATGRLDTGAIILFFILTAWQMPHFYSIALFRYQDYKAAGLPVLPVAKSTKQAQYQALAYIVIFLAVTSLLTAFGYTGYSFTVVVGGVSIWWLYSGVSTIKFASSKVWGKQMFLKSLIVIMVLSIMTALGSWLP